MDEEKSVSSSCNLSTPSSITPSISPPTNQAALPVLLSDSDLNLIAQIMRDQELGKLVINLAVPVAIALLLAKLPVFDGIAVGLMIDCMAVWNGILFRNTFSRLSNILEQFEIILVLLLLYGLVASILPTGFSIVTMVSRVLCLLPFIYARIKS